MCSNLSRASPLWPPALAQLCPLPQHGCVHHATGWWWKSSASLRWQDGKGYGWHDGEQGWAAVWCAPSLGVTSCLGDLRMHAGTRKLLVSHQ